MKTKTLLTITLLILIAPGLALASPPGGCRLQIQQAPVAEAGNGVEPSSAQDLWLTGSNRQGTWRYNGNICLGHLAKGLDGILHGVDADKGHLLTAVPVAPAAATLFTPSAGIVGEGYDGFPFVDTAGTTQDPGDMLGLDIPFPGLAFDFEGLPEKNALYDVIEGQTYWAAIELEVFNAVIDAGFAVGDKLGIMFTWSFDPNAPYPQHNIEQTGGWMFSEELGRFIPFLNEELLLFQIDCN